MQYSTSPRVNEVMNPPRRTRPQSWPRSQNWPRSFNRIFYCPVVHIAGATYDYEAMNLKVMNPSEASVCVRSSAKNSRVHLNIHLSSVIR